ncbi:MAG: ABC transporter permease [Acidobacteriota bacterium]
MTGLLQDLRHALRTLAKAPAFTAIAIATLAIGIGANTAIFSLVDGVLLRPLPYPSEHRLVWVRETQPDIEDAPASPADFLDWRAGTKSFEALAASEFRVVTMTGRGAPERVVAAGVTENLFAVLRISPRLGPGLAGSESSAGGDRRAVLSDSFWRRLGSPKTGSTVRLDGELYAIAGVMPANFDYPQGVQAWMPLALTPDARANRESHYLQIIGRLAPAASIETAQAEMTSLETRLAAAYPHTNAGHGARVVSLREELVGPLRRTLVVLLGAVALVLLLACVNLGNLLLAKNAARGRELAIRSAIGAGRLRLVRQLLTESVLLGLTGGLAGVALAAWGIELLSKAAPWNLGPTSAARMDGRVLLFTLAASILTSMIFGLVPALTLSSKSLTAALQTSSRTTSGVGRGPARAVLAVAQIAIALALLIGAGLMVRSAARLSGVDPGFAARNVLALRLALPGSRYASDDAARRFVREAADRVASVPGVSAVAAVNAPPLDNNSTNGNFDIEGRPDWAPGQDPIADYRVVSPGYWKTLEIPIRSGRALSDADREGATPVALINETMARRFWPGESPLGRRIRVEWGSDREWRAVVGVVADVRANRLDRVPIPEIYFPFAQHPRPTLSLVIRTTLPPETALRPVQKAIWSIDADLPVPSLTRMADIVSRTFVRRRFSTLLLTVFGATALLLASLGVYGVLSQLVSERRREFGIRMTLGAQRSDVFALVARRGFALTSTGIVLGVVGAFLVTRSLGALLFDISPTDPATFAALVALMAAVSFLATAIPARRATRVDPVIAMRAD